MTLAARLAPALKRVENVAPWLIPVVIGTLIVHSPAAIVERARNLVFDQYQSLAPRPWSPDYPVRVLAIDDETLAAYGQWPWPRDLMADLTNRLAALGPSAIGFDIFFSEEDRLSTRNILRRLPDTPERATLESALAANGELQGDKFAKAIQDAPVVLAESFLNDDGKPEAPEVKSGFVAMGDDPTGLALRFHRALAPLPVLRNAAAGVGAANFAPDGDLTLRRAPLVFAVGPEGSAVLAPSLDLELLRVAQIDPADHTQPGPSPMIKSTGASSERGFGGDTGIVSVRIGQFDIPTEATGEVRIRFAGHQPGRFLSAKALMEGGLKPEDVNGRIVIVGLTAASLDDIRPTPINGAVPGVEVHAEVLEHAISGARLTRPDYANGVEVWATALGGLLAAWIARRFHPLFSAIGILALAGLAGEASWLSFARMSMLFDPMLPAATWLATWASTTAAVLRHTENERRFVRSAFSRYLSPDVVERIAADPGSLKLGGEAREVTILFSDARNFTARSEQLSAEGVVHFLNTLLTPLTAAVLENDGTIDKYMGDGMMAFWNAPLDEPDHATLACRAALDMIAAIPKVDQDMRDYAARENRPHMDVAIGIGVNTGRAFVGNMGSEQRFDYSMVGDPVNVSARLEASSKEFGAPIIVSEETYKQARGFRFVPLGSVALKGRGAEATVYALHGRETDPDPDFESFLRAHEEVLWAAAGDGDIAKAVSAAKAFPQAARYETVYRRIVKRRGAVKSLSTKFGDS